MNSFSQKAFGIFKQNVFVFVVLMATSIVIARVLGPEKMGQWSILLLMPTYAAAFARLKVDESSVQLINTNKYRINEVSFALLIITLLSILTMASVCYFQQERIFGSILISFTDHRLPVYLMFISIPLDFLSLNYSYLLLSKEDVKHYNMLTVIKNLVSPFGVILVLLSAGANLELMAFTLIVSKLASLGYGVYALHKTFSMKVAFNKELYKDLIIFSVKLYVGSIISFFSTFIAGFVIVLMAPTNQVAFHQIAIRRTRLVGKISGSIGSIYYPRIASMSNLGDYETEFASKVFRINMLIMFLIGVGAVVLARPAILLLYGSEYKDVIIPFIILIPGIILESCTSLLTQFFIARAKLFVTIWLALLALILQLLFLALLVPSMGIIGAAIATSTGLIIESLIRIAAYKKISRTTYKEMFYVGKPDFIFIYRFFSNEMKKYIPNSR